MEKLSHIIHQKLLNGDRKPVKISRGGLEISHLFFTDDILLFCRAVMGDLVKIQDILTLYEQASDQQINRGKTTIFFSKAITEERKEEISNFLGVKEVKEYEKHLGLPAMVGKNRRASLNYIKERVWNKLQGWKKQLLSQAGREVLLKAMVQAIPTFVMPCFKLPVGLCHDIEMLIRKFWWGQRGEQRKIHWRNWEVMCQPKDQGNLINLTSLPLTQLTTAY